VKSVRPRIEKEMEEKARAEAEYWQSVYEEDKLE
jgi:hypothetical protein